MGASLRRSSEFRGSRPEGGAAKGAKVTPTDAKWCGSGGYRSDGVSRRGRVRVRECFFSEGARFCALFARSVRVRTLSLRLLTPWAPLPIRAKGNDCEAGRSGRF